MIWAILILLLGLLLAVIPVLLRKKLGRSWISSLLAAGILLAACGGWLTYGQWIQAQEKREAVYLSLRYLERYESASASFYIKKAGPADDYLTACTRCLLEQVRGNDLVARLNLDIAQTLAGSSQETAFLTTLKALDVQNRDQLSLAVDKMTGFLKLSTKRQAALDLYVQAESGGYGLDGQDLQAAGLDEIALSRLQISSLLQNGAYESAISEATRLADRQPSADNRLLLAEAVAESAYNRIILSDRVFVEEGGPKEDDSIRKERQALEEQRLKLESELMELEIAINAAPDQTALQPFNEQRLVLTEQINAIQNRSDKLYVYRAFSAIADLHSLEAKLVRARLYFALQDYDQAVNALLDTAHSLRAKFTADESLANALRIVDQVYTDDSTFHDSQEFRDAVTQLLSAPFSDLMYLSQTPLTQDFMQRIVSDQKSYAQDLFLSSLNVQDFPTVRVTLSGREDLLHQVVEQTGISARDTHQEIQYTALMQETALSNICVVVDRSGSMGGAPMDHLKSALDNFVRDMSDNTLISLVAFDNDAQRLTELTQDRALLLSMVNSLSSGGGTDIAAGIQAGTEALEPAAGGQVMLLMTDGQSSIDFSVVDDAAAAGITIHTIGFGSVNDELLEQIAQRTGGQYIKADSSAELSNVYASLQQVIGNIVTLEYTVSNPEVTQQRYVFLRVGNSSIHRDYSLSAKPELPQLYTCSPSLISPDELERVAQRNSALTLALSGEHLLDVTSAAVNGQAAQITGQTEDTLSLSLPAALSAGWQTVTLTLAGGAQRSFDRLLLVGSAQPFQNLRLGSLTIPSALGVLPGDGTLVLLGERIPLTENVSSQRSSLSLFVHGTLILPWRESISEETPDPEEPPTIPSDPLNLGSRGSITGWGTVILNREDSAYTDGAPTLVAKGELTLVCEPEQSRLIQLTEGGN